jgi:hypothetical protein
MPSFDEQSVVCAQRGEARGRERTDGGYLVEPSARATVREMPKGPVSVTAPSSSASSIPRERPCLRWTKALRR